MPNCPRFQSFAPSASRFAGRQATAPELVRRNVPGHRREHVRCGRTPSVDTLRPSSRAVAARVFTGVMALALLAFATSTRVGFAAEAPRQEQAQESLNSHPAASPPPRAVDPALSLPLDDAPPPVTGVDGPGWKPPTSAAVPTAFPTGLPLADLGLPPGDAAAVALTAPTKMTLAPATFAGLADRPAASLPGAKAFPASRLIVAPQAAGSDLLVDSVASNSTPTGQADQKGSPYTISSDQTYDRAYVGLNGTGMLTQSGGTLNLSGALYLGYNSGSLGTYNLNGGTLATTGVSNFSGQGVFHFNGGTLQASADNTTFLAGPSLTADVRNGGAVIDTNGHNVTITQGLQHSSISGDLATDGGLTKYGAGTLTLTGTNTYTGITNVSAGTLAITGGSVGVANSPASLAVDGSGTGAAAATFSLSGGSLSTGQATIGVRDTGSFTQTGGTFTTNGSALYLGVLTGSSGTYTLSNNGSLGTVYAYIGSSGTGSFTQTGGTFTTNGMLLGYESSAKGTYNLQGGTLTTGSVVGRNGTSTFHFNGGTLQANADNATFMQDLTTADVQGGGAKIDTNGHAITIVQGLTSGTPSGTIDGGLTKLGAGTLTLTGTNNYTGGTNVNAGTLAVNGSGSLGDTNVNVNTGAALQVTGTATLLQSASKALLVNGTSAAPATATFSSTGTSTLGRILVGDSGMGTLTQSAGTLNVTSSLLLGGGTHTSGTYTLQGGTLSTGGGIIGAFGTSVFHFNGGTLQASADSTTFMQGLTIADVGGSGTRANSGVVIDTNGHAITIAQNLTSSGTSGGDGGLTKVGAGTLTLTGMNTYTGVTKVSAGTLAITGGSTGVANSRASLTVDGSGTGAAAATFSLSGGSLSTGLAIIGNLGTGVFNQSGGSFTTNGSTLILGGSNGSSGTYNLQGGALSTGYADIGGDGTSSFNQSGGSFTTNGGSLIVGSMGNSTYTLSAGTLTTGYTQVSDQANTSSFTQTGGTYTTIGLSLSGRSTSSQGTYTLAGGVLNTGFVANHDGNDNTKIGTSVFHFNGGTLQASADSTTFMQGLTTADVQGGGAKIDTNGHAITIAQNLTSGSNYGGLTKLGVGTLTLTGMNTYTGSTNVNAGTLAITGGSTGVAANLSAFLRVDGSGTGAAAATLSLSGGSLNTSDAYIGGSSTGVFNQSGGSFSTNGNALILGDRNGSSGTYNLSGTGSLNTGLAIIGSSGTGVFNQSGGSFSTGGTLDVGEIGAGAYTLSGGTLTTGYTQVSDDANTGSFTQTGGTHTTNGLSLSGYSTSSQGTYTLSGGTLNTGFVANHDGNSTMVGTSTFHFNGGTLQASQSTSTFMQGLTTADVQSGGATGNTAGGAVLDTQGYNVTVAQNLVHDTRPNAPATDGGLTKQGVGTLTLTGTSNYTGPTQVSAGTLAVNGALQGPGMLTVASAATLSGTGTVAGAVQVQGGGVLSAGLNGTGTLALASSLTLANTATAAFTLGGTAGSATVAGSGYTQAQVGGQLTLGGATLRLSVASGFTLAVGQTFYLFDEPGTGSAAAVGTFGNAPGGVYTDAAGDTFAVNYLANDPADGSVLLNDVSVRVLSVVPEPGTWAALAVGGGLGLLGWTARRRRGLA